MSDLWTNHFSFSQLHMAADCPYSYFLLKINGIEPEDNPFSQAGSLAHRLLAAWARGEVSLQDLSLLWKEQYRRVVTDPFPPYLEKNNYSQKLFQQFLSFFEQFTGYPEHEILGSEREFVSSLAGEKFVGVIDLILRHKTTGDLMIVDYKSCSLSSFRKMKDDMYRQLILYSKHCADSYGQFPSVLSFNLIKEGLIDQRPYKPADYLEVKNWAEEEIEKIKNRDVTDWMQVNPDFFKCCNLCSARGECKFGRPENHAKSTKRVRTVAA